MFSDQRVANEAVEQIEIGEGDFFLSPILSRPGQLIQSFVDAFVIELKGYEIGVVLKVTVD